MLKNDVISQTLFLPEIASISQRLFHIKYDLKEPVFCTCGKIAPFISLNKGYQKHCSRKCGQGLETQIKRKQTWLKKYGVDNPLKSMEIREKSKQTCLEKYGVEYTLQSDVVRNQSKKTCLEKYGVDHPMRVDKIKEKQIQTCQQRQGVQYPMQSEKVREKSKKTCLEKYGVEFSSQSNVFKEKVRQCYRKKFYRALNSDRLKGLVKPLFSLEEYTGVDTKYKFQCVKCNNIFEGYLYNGRIPRCYNCYPVIKNISSKYEEEIYNWLNSLDIINIQRNIRSVIGRCELDIYLPVCNLAIEFNGLWSHSEVSGNKDKNYHLNKTNLCKEKGIELIHIFEDEWINKQDIVKSIIKNKLGLIDNKIYARECEIKEVDKEEAVLFLINNHLQEPVVSRYNYGLYFNDELVYLISLSKSRFNKNYEYELIRSCGKINTNVIGGFNKLINYAKKELNITSLISYVDKRYFNGKGYKDWNLINETSPNYFYTKDYMNRESRIKYQKHKIIENENDTLLTEWQIMQLKGYDRIWDCGNKVFVTTN